MPDFDLAPVYWVEWIDSSQVDGWTFRTSDCGGDLRVRTIGFLVFQDDERITLSAAHSANGAMSAPITIPRLAITDLREVVWTAKGGGQSW